MTLEAAEGLLEACKLAYPKVDLLTKKTLKAAIENATGVRIHVPVRQCHWCNRHFQELDTVCAGCRRELGWE